MQRIINIVKKRAKRKFDENDNLIQNAIIDSIDFISIMLELEREFNVKIDFTEVEPQNLTTIKGLWRFINGLE